MNTETTGIGDIYVEVAPPRREWRIIEVTRPGHYALERVDRPRVLRFLDDAALHDPRRYARKE